MTGKGEERVREKSAVRVPEPSSRASRRQKAEQIIDRVRERMGACIQCGTCSASCPNQGFMDLTPRRMWRMVLGGRTEALLASRSFIYCSACYTCTLRCPRGLPLTLAMAELKQAGALMRLPQSKASDLFYQVFLDNVRRYGRIREMELMGRYFWGLKNPVLPLSYTPLGLALLRRRKVRPELPVRGTGKLDRLFKSVLEEGAP